jgi:hypothetical protein
MILCEPRGVSALSMRRIPASLPDLLIHTVLRGKNRR